MQLEQLGFQFECLPSQIDEEPFKDNSSDHTVVAENLAHAKADFIFKSHPEALVIGSDQLVSFKGQILGKPKTREANIKQILDLQGQSHQLITSLCMLMGERKQIRTNITTLKMRPLDRKQVETYVEKEPAYDCAGGYKIEGLGQSLFESIDTDDFSSIVGLPLLYVTDMYLELSGHLPFT